MPAAPPDLPPAPPPALVTLHVWRVRPAEVPRAMARMALDRRPLRRSPGLRFGRLLGTADGATFAPGDANLRRWAVVASWASPEDARRFETSALARRWRRRSEEQWRLELRPIAARGRWSRRAPFGAPAPTRWDGPVAAITRARLAPRRAATFWRSVPPVAGALRHQDGLLAAFGIGEAPLGWQGTFSAWRDPAALRSFAYDGAAHRAVIEQTDRVGWYAEQLFARFAIVGSDGTLDGRDPLA